MSFTHRSDVLTTPLKATTSPLDLPATIHTVQHIISEPVHPYTIPALRPSGSVLVHPNTLTIGLTLPEFRSAVNPFRVKLIAPFFTILSSVLAT
ncbi:hypothetical protein PAXINDRAFT_21370 [Paxillus involutus ATCC 200175]|uniref:Uncharacterized protein n=1 Tax=Paxillus involutus ATCC 200175 TaxID=664439 RepID=A0A0C9TAW1_PAXIN|nr:hypothetical protein PAXINDRAFT_21370 [Paxillus involutus ATCC 200175]